MLGERVLCLLANVLLLWSTWYRFEIKLETQEGWSSTRPYSPWPYSITLRAGHKLSKLLPLKRNFRCNLGPTPRTITNRFKNSVIPNMFFFVLFCFCLVFFLFVLSCCCCLCLFLVCFLFFFVFAFVFFLFFSWQVALLFVVPLLDTIPIKFLQSRIYNRRQNCWDTLIF